MQLCVLALSGAALSLLAVGGAQIGSRLKAASPASKTLMVTLANGAANSGYIYADDA